MQLRLGQPESVHVRLDFKLDRVGHYEVKSLSMSTQIQLEFHLKFSRAHYSPYIILYNINIYN